MIPAINLTSASACRAAMRAITRTAILILIATLSLRYAAAQNTPNQPRRVQQQDSSSPGLQTLDNPAGGHVVYGPMEDAMSMPQAMAYMLRQIHGRFGDRPQIGRFFQSRSKDSLATFFTLTARKQDGKAIAGLVIVSTPQGAKPAAAVLYDDASRFSKTESTLMNMLNSAWHKQSELARTSKSGNAQPQLEEAAVSIPAMTRQSIGDGTGTISLPANWRITGGGSGAVHIAGPNGEALHMGVMIQNIYDPRNPKAARLIQYMRMGRQQVIVCPRTNDLVTDYLCVSKQMRASQNKSPLNFNLLQRSPGPNNGEIVNAKIDEGDGAGMKLAKLQLSAMPEGPQGGWVLTVFAELAPEKSAARAWPIITAIANSYQQNGRALFAQSQNVVNEIHARSTANTELAKARSDANDAHNRAVEQYWDDNAKYNKSFENYTLDRSVIQSTDLDAHGTFSNRTADFLVQSFPDRFQYVQTNDLLKGIDY